MATNYEFTTHHCEHDMSKLQSLNIEATQQTSTAYDPGPKTLNPNEVTYLNKPSTDQVFITLSAVSGTIDAVSSVPVLTWTQSGASWVSSAIAMPAAPGNTPINLTITMDGARGHDPTFTIKNDRR